MLNDLAAGQKVTGAKQAGRAVRSGLAKQVFLAGDADPKITAPLLELCEKQNIPVTTSYTMRQLGQAAGIQVGAAVVALLK